jgi:hypothetical protein
MSDHEIRAAVVIRMQKRSNAAGGQYRHAPDLAPARQSGHAVPVGADETVCGLDAETFNRLPGEWEHLNPWSRCEDCEQWLGQTLSAGHK